MGDASDAAVTGDAAQRTLLSWQRTAISTAGVAVLVVRAGIVKGLLGVAVPAAALLTLAAAAEWLFSLQIAASAAVGADRSALVDRAVLAVGASTAVAAWASLVLALG